MTASDRGSLTASELARSYLAALSRGDVHNIVKLFADDAIVHSPLYGPMPPERFYPQIFTDTSQAKLTLHGVTEGHGEDGTPLIAFWFHFDWHMASGRAVPFNVVDIAELSDEGRIRALHIIYDTVNTRPAFEAGLGSSYRAAPPGQPVAS